MTITTDILIIGGECGVTRTGFIQIVSHEQAPKLAASTSPAAA